MFYYNYLHKVCLWCMSRRKPTCVSADPASVCSHETGHPEEPLHVAHNAATAGPREPAAPTGNSQQHTFTHIYTDYGCDFEVIKGWTIYRCCRYYWPMFVFFYNIGIGAMCKNDICTFSSDIILFSMFGCESRSSSYCNANFFL